MLSMQVRNQLLFTMISQNGGYHLVRRVEKTRLLNEYCKVTGQNRKAVIRKIKTGQYVKSLRKEKGEEKRRRKKTYGKDVAAVLIKVWKIFDHPCGQRLQPILQDEVERLRDWGEIDVSEEMMAKMKKISARSIDAVLAPHKEKERLNKKYQKKIHPLLYQKIPVKLSHEQGHGIGETIQIDLVEHCGLSAKGPFINTVSTTDVGSGWWEGKAIFGKEAKEVHQALYKLEGKYPFPWEEIHPDNGTEFINETVYEFTKGHNLRFSRSRPYGKNDNCFVEQKNSTHVRKIVGHQRYDTKEELDTLNQLYDDLTLYKNFFQPIIPLRTKKRVAGHVRRTYGAPRTPYQNVLAADHVSKKKKQQLARLYESLNPAKLKRQIKEKQDRLWKLKKLKEQEQTAAITMKQELDNSKNLIQFSVANLIAEPMGVR